MSISAVDPRVAQLALPMSVHQKFAVFVIVLLCMVDGLDVMAITFTVPAIRSLWGISQAQVGLVLSSALLGMAAGSLFLAPLADFIGRRRLIFLSLAMMIAGTLWTATSRSVTELMWSRVFTGIGVGAMVAVISPMTAEYASARSRDFCQTMYGIGFPIGGLLGGMLAGTLLPTHGWTALFYVASALGLVLMPVVWLYLPEPIAPMIARPKYNTLARVNDYLKRCGRPTIDSLPPPPATAQIAPLKALFASGMAGVTMLITGIYFMHVITLFFVMSWAPSLVTGLGFAPGQAAKIAVFVNVGGIIGGPLLGANSMRFGLKLLVIIAMCGGAIASALFGLLPPSFALLALGSAVMGFFLQAAIHGLYAVVARTFPADMRASGTGFVIGVGRIGSAISPVMAGMLMSAGLSRSSVAFAMAVPALLAALLLYKFRVRAPDTP